MDRRDTNQNPLMKKKHNIKCVANPYIDKSTVTTANIVYSNVQIS